MPQTNSLEKLFLELGFTPKDPKVFELAFIHPSFNALTHEQHDYERLEFLGDSLVGFVVSELCYELHPNLRQGDLSKMKSYFIQTKGEASYARKLHLETYIKTGPSLRFDFEKAPRILEDVFESFIGALLLDQGLNFTHDFLVNLFREDIKNASFNYSNENPKSALQEAVQSSSKLPVTYRLIEMSGPSHDPTFTVAVEFEGEELGRGIGHSKKEAETKAAAAALKKMAVK